MKENIWLDYKDNPSAGARAALEFAANMLLAMGYTQSEYGSDATGTKCVLKKGGVKVVLEIENKEAKS